MSRLPKISPMAMPAIISAGAVLVAGMVTLPQVEIGPLSLHMVQHLAIMNLGAPIAAIALANTLNGAALRPSLLWVAALLQIVLLWAFHIPSVQQAAAGSATLHLIMIISLALAALLFWALLLACAAKARWRAVAVLPLTGKLACLLGGLLIFAPRELYGLPGFASFLCSVGPSTLADQQLAGLLMVTACPLSYVVAGTVIAARMMFDLEQTSAVMAPRKTVVAG